MKHRTILLSCVLSASLGAAVQKPQTPYERGREEYRSGNFKRAVAFMSHAALQGTDAKERARAFYYQGLSLLELGYFYSAYASFRQVLTSAEDGNRAVYDRAIRSAVFLTDRLNMVERIGSILEKFPERLIPEPAMSHARYAMGVASMQKGGEDKARTYFRGVSGNTEFYAKAQFYLGVLAVKRKDYAEGIQFFKKTAALVQGKKQLQDIAELARLNWARAVYASGNLEQSIGLFSRFTSLSPHWLTILLEASWPLMRVKDTTISLGNLHTVLSPFHRESMVGDGYLLRATILYSLCKFEEMKKTLAAFFQVYDPILRSMEAEAARGPGEYYRAYAEGKGLTSGFLAFLRRDTGLSNDAKAVATLRKERGRLGRVLRGEMLSRISRLIEEAERDLVASMGQFIQKLHERKLAELKSQREQANYLKVEIVTGEKSLAEGDLVPGKKELQVDTEIAAGYQFWPFKGEYWEDELGSYIYTVESACR